MRTPSDSLLDATGRTLSWSRMASLFIVHRSSLIAKQLIYFRVRIVEGAYTAIVSLVGYLISCFFLLVGN